MKLDFENLTGQNIIVLPRPIIRINWLVDACALYAENIERYQNSGNPCDHVKVDMRRYDHLQHCYEKFV